MMERKRRPIVMLSGAILTGLIFSGCDKSPSPPPAALNQPATLPAGPIALSGRNHALHLHAAPISLQAPVEWTLETFGGETSIQAPLHNNVEAEIIITRLQPMNKRIADRWLESATRPTAANVMESNLRETNGMKVRETVSEFGRAASRSSTEPGTIDWHVYFLIEEGAEFVPYGLSINHLSLKDYQDQKDFIEATLATAQQD